MYQGIYLYAQHADLDTVIEIGPDKRYTTELRKMYEQTRPVFAYFDTAEDRAFVLENLFYRKHFNNLYAAKRMLGIAAATQNYNQSTEGDEKIVAAYLALKTYVDEMMKKQSMGRDAFVSDYDFNLCVDQLKDILTLKQVPTQEVQARILDLRNEIAFDLCPSFAPWFS
jgi:[acyl-carrier-protein] S-malonyltransferase